MEIEWDTASKRDWERLTKTAGAPLQQDWAYGCAVSGFGARVHRALIRNGNKPIGLAQITARRFCGLVSWALCTRGPVWTAELDEKTKATVYRALRKTLPLPRPRALFFTPNEYEEHASLKLARLRQVMTGYSLVTLDLTREGECLRAGMHGKWRNRLRAAEKSTLNVRRSGSKPAQYKWLLAKEEEQRSRKHYGALPVCLVEAFQTSKGTKESVRIWSAEFEDRTVGAMMFLLHGQGATYHIGWLDPDGRRLGAHNLILWHAMTHLKKNGITTLDLGGIDTERAPGLARFKLGTGGAPTTLCGTYASL